MHCSIIHPVYYFNGVHELLCKFTASPAPRFGIATARSVAQTLPQCVRSKKQIPFSGGLTFKRRGQPECVQTCLHCHFGRQAVSLLSCPSGQAGVTFCDDRK